MTLTELNDVYDHVGLAHGGSAVAGIGEERVSELAGRGETTEIRIDRNNGFVLGGVAEVLIDLRVILST